MTKLYELSGEYARLQALAEDGEDVESALVELGGELSAKCEGIARVLASMDGGEEAIDAELKRLKARKAAATNARERLRDYLRTNMAACGIERIKTPLFTISVRQSPPRVEVDDEGAVPAEFTRTTTSVDKAAVLAAFKRDGEMVPGTRIEHGTTLTIK